ncbi:hypothetical protein M0M42_07065 [Pseudomonas knackmussii]|uniref:Uncharacterized protein n=1 Tax=Pseudomonas knackmussii TaxID=65741 RepID=A0ABY4KTE1_9PSED|nr:hypothetical protein [Pseudomonas knackmussii]UPQ84152.1 hypothetical protein M0M42_07065 [Pseudomonas knackmussii]
MIEWLMNNQQLISLLISASTLLVWVFYAQLLLLNFRRQRKPSLIINRGAGKGLGSLCLISNMSAEPMFINQLTVSIETSKGPLEVDVTDIRQSIDEEDGASPDLPIYQTTHQGPMRSGDFIHIGTFQGMLLAVAEQHGIELDGLKPVGDWEFHTLEVRAVAFYGPERHPIGVLRRFRLHGCGEPDCALIPESPFTHQLLSRRDRRKVRQWLSESLG